MKIKLKWIVLTLVGVVVVGIFAAVALVGTQAVLYSVHIIGSRTADGMVDFAAAAIGLGAFALAGLAAIGFAMIIRPIVTIAVLALVSYNWFADDTNIIKVLVVMATATILAASSVIVMYIIRRHTWAPSGDKH